MGRDREGAEGAGEGERSAPVGWGLSATRDKGLSAPFRMLPMRPEEPPGPRPPRPHGSASSCAQSGHNRGPLNRCVTLGKGLDLFMPPSVSASINPGLLCNSTDDSVKRHRA